MLKSSIMSYAFTLTTHSTYTGSPIPVNYRALPSPMLFYASWPNILDLKASSSLKSKSFMPSLPFSCFIIMRSSGEVVEVSDTAAASSCSTVSFSCLKVSMD